MSVAYIIQLAPIITPFVTVASVIIAARLGYGTASKAKVWDFRRVAYSEILAELSTVERICNAADEYIQENVHAYFEGEVSTRHSETINQHMASVRARYATDYLIFSSKFIDACEEFWLALDSIPPDEIPPDEQNLFAGAVRKFRPKLLTQARAEIYTGR
jgi:hypothetical protein